MTPEGIELAHGKPICKFVVNIPPPQRQEKSHELHPAVWFIGTWNDPTLRSRTPRHDATRLPVCGPTSRLQNGCGVEQPLSRLLQLCGQQSVQLCSGESRPDYWNDLLQIIAGR